MPSGTLVLVLIVAALALAGGVFAVFSYRRALALLTPRRRPPERHPREFGLAVEEVRIAGPRGALAAWYLPARNGCTLLCCHGIHDNRGQWVEQIALLHERSGYGALLFDFAGHGDSDGRLCTYGARETLDVAAAMAYLRERGDVDMSRLGIMGYSLGAITAVLAAAHMPELRAVVLESGFADLERDLGMLFTRYTGWPAFPFAQIVVFWGQLIGGVKLAEIRPMRVIGRISPRAVFIISDLRDELANEPFDGEHLYQSAREPKQWWQVEEAGHVAAFQLLPEEWVRRVGDFLDDYLASASSAPPEQDARLDEVAGQAG